MMLQVFPKPLCILARPVKPALTIRSQWAILSRVSKKNAVRNAWTPSINLLDASIICAYSLLLKYHGCIRYS